MGARRLADARPRSVVVEQAADGAGDGHFVALGNHHTAAVGDSSGIAPDAVTTTGRAAAIASTTTSPNASSHNDGMTMTSAAAKTRSTSSRNPRKRT